MMVSWLSKVDVMLVGCVLCVTVAVAVHLSRSARLLSSTRGNRASAQRLIES